MAPKGGGGGETCCIHRNEEKRVCSKRFPRQGRLSQVHFITAKLRRQTIRNGIFSSSTVSQASGGKRLSKWAKEGGILTKFSLSSSRSALFRTRNGRLAPLLRCIRPSSSFHYRCCPNRKWRRRRPDSLPRLLTEL